MKSAVDFPQVARAFEEELTSRAWKLVELQRATAAMSKNGKPLDTGTIGTAVRGQTWPETANRGRLEAALGWNCGWMAPIREGVPLRTLKESRGDKVATPVAPARPEHTHLAGRDKRPEIEAELQRRRPR